VDILFHKHGGCYDDVRYIILLKKIDELLKILTNLQVYIQFTSRMLYMP